MITTKHIRHYFCILSAFSIAACTSSYSASSKPQPAIENTAEQSGELRKIADQLAAEGDHKAAIPIYRHLASKDKSTEILEALSSSLLAQGLIDEAYAILEPLSEKGDASGMTWYNLGKIALSTGEYNTSLQYFSEAVKKDPSNEKYLSGKAISLAVTGAPEEGLALLANSRDASSLSNRALLLVATDRSVEAIGVLEPVVRSGDGGVRERQNLAMAYLMSGDAEKAYGIARLDLDDATLNETFTFYRSLENLRPEKRMEALITGTVRPEWSREQAANLNLVNDSSRQLAATRQLEIPAPVTAEPEPVKEVVEDRSTYELTEVPPLVEPEGWALQIGAYRTLKQLMRGWTILYRQSGDLLQDIPPRRSEVDFGDREGSPSGFYYRLNAGPLKTLAEARALCKKLKARETKCWIRPPEKTEGNLPSSDQKGGTPPESSEGQSTDSPQPGTMGKSE